MIGGISFSATSITAGLDAEKPANPKAGNQYLATDTNILYVCYIAGVWVNVLGDLLMVAGADITLFSDPTSHLVWVNNPNYTTVHQYIIEDIKGFTEVQSFYINCDFDKNKQGDTTYWYVKVNGVTKESGSFINNTDAWVNTTITPVAGDLKPGDVIEIGMSRSGAVGVSRPLQYKSLVIKCANPALSPKFGLSIS